MPLRKNDPRAARCYLGDCLEVLPKVPAGSIALVLADPPYGTTACKWDSVIPLEPMWRELRRVLRPRGAVVLMAAQPFTTTLITSNRGWFKYCWYWEKSKGANFAMTGFQPLKVVEEVVVFSPAACTYTKNGNNILFNAQKEQLARPYRAKFANYPNRGTISAPLQNDRIREKEFTTAHPRSLLYATTYKDGRVHPTQKPLALIEYFVRTYTNETDTVLDFCMGSGTTGVACVQAGRKFIGIELSPEYHAIATCRIEEAQLEVLANGSLPKE